MSEKLKGLIPEGLQRFICEECGQKLPLSERHVIDYTFTSEGAEAFGRALEAVGKKVDQFKLSELVGQACYWEYCDECQTEAERRFSEDAEEGRFVIL